jgi:hypothetical protein
MLQSRGVLAGAGSAASLIGAALVSLLLSAGLVAISAWPEASRSSVPSVAVPAAPPARAPATGAPAAPVAQAPTVVLAPAAAPATGGGAISVSRPGVPAPTPPTASQASAPSPVAQPAPDVRPTRPLRSATDDVASTTTEVTRRAGSAVGGQPGSAVQGAGEHVADVIRQVGGAASDLLEP